ncbi:cytosolic sulfotransferase 5-like [Pistacia vera]|uniref:cytosolic sulfotransferase 5-like n=1 Tax=Pistacia vera TaxID=55513 RepID=UPI001262E723|nr:cytosolic sulfotransferase 5-like [Pistacia vera]
MEKRVDSHNLSPATEEKDLSKEIELLSSQLRKATNWDGSELCQYQGFWCRSEFLHGIIPFQRHFQAQDSDLILITFPKSGTTWLKAITFTIVNRPRYALENSPLLTTSPHVLVPFLEFDLFMRNQPPSPISEDLPTPRIFSTPTPYASLPNSVVNSNCRIVYMCRNPLDQFISHWKFLIQIHQDQSKELVSFDEAFETVCNGVQGFGPIWEHVLGYWKASKEQPHKILFLKYEDLKENINFQVKRMADFLGCPFTENEKSKGIVEEISKFCSFDNMKNLEVNKTGILPSGAKYSDFYRKGQVGDWKNYLTPSMSKRLEKVYEEKFSGSGLTFKTS